MKTLIAVFGVILVWMVFDLHDVLLRERRLRLFVRGRSPESIPSVSARIQSVLVFLGRWYQRYFVWPRAEVLTLKIQKAGLLGRLSADALVGGKMFCATLGLLFGCIIRDGLTALACFVVMFFVPDLYLMILADKRQAETQKHLPHIIDLLIIATEAGMSFENALDVVTRYNNKGLLYREMRQVLDEIRLGSSQESALRHLVQRIDHPDISSFALTLIQGQKLGTPIGKVLSVVAHQVRVKRATACETEASKAPIKILFPLLLFIFPSLLLVLLGPIMLRKVV